MANSNPGSAEFEKTKQKNEVQTKKLMNQLQLKLNKMWGSKCEVQLTLQILEKQINTNIN